jgi:predicted DNA-binding transcriptional regulator AlpA
MAMKKREASGPVVRWEGAMLYAGCGVTRLRELIAKGAFPKPFKISEGGRNVVFLRSELEAWLAARVTARQSNQEPAGPKAARDQAQAAPKKQKARA